MCSSGEGLESVNLLLENIRRVCKKGKEYEMKLILKGSVLGVEEVKEALNGVNGNGTENDITLIEVYDAFDSGYVHYESSSRQYSM